MEYQNDKHELATRLKNGEEVLCQEKRCQRSISLHDLLNQRMLCLKHFRKWHHRGGVMYKYDPPASE